MSLVKPAEAVGRGFGGGAVWGQREDDEALAPMAVFAARRGSDNSGAGGVVLFEREAGKAAYDGLKLVVVGRTVGGERDQGAQCAVGFSQVAYPGAAFGRQRFEAKGLPGGMGVALYKDALRLGAGLGKGLGEGVQTSPATAAEGIVNIQAEFGEGPVGDGLDHAWEAGFGGGVQLAFADPGVLKPVGAGLPGLGSVEHDYADSTEVAEVVEMAGKDVGVDLSAIVGGNERRDDFAGNGGFGLLAGTGELAI